MVRVDAFPRIDSNVLNDVVALTSPPATLQSVDVKVVKMLYFDTAIDKPLVSNGPEEGALVHIMGTIPMARAIARTRSSAITAINISICIHRLWGRTNIPVWRSHRRRRDTKHLLNRLACPSELCNDLLIC